ncbi:MAG TPA: hypothetical protein VHG70_06085 [Nocardioidaceae bacterium]|nr:hypothetical protein [Nocardioidaceae bacterium]
MNTSKIRASVAAAAIAATLFTPSIAEAGDGETVRSGACSGVANWKLKLSPQNGRIEVEYEVDANRRGQQWRVTLFHNGRRVMRDTLTTRGLSGSFSVTDLEPNRAGNDAIRARAVRLGNGQTCSGRASF